MSNCLGLENLRAQSGKTRLVDQCHPENSDVDQGLGLGLANRMEDTKVASVIQTFMLFLEASSLLCARKFWAEGFLMVETLMVTLRGVRTPWN